MSHVKISLQICKILAPNCGGGDPLTATFTLTDAAGHTGTAVLNGSKNAINAIDHSNYLHLEGNDGTSTITTVFGNVNVAESYDPDFEIDDNIEVSLHVVDCLGIHNIEDYLGYTNAVMTDDNEYVMDESGNYLAFIQ